MIVVGGTYNEYCFEPLWEQKFGSGLRACMAINGLDSTENIEYYTFGDSETEEYLNFVTSALPVFKKTVTRIPRAVKFSYQHPLSTPTIFPSLDIITRYGKSINVTGENILFYGMIEGDAIVKGRNVVYDPQSPSNPIPFSLTKSEAQNLAVVVNISEASIMAKSSDLEAIKAFFFEKEMVNVLVLKMGPKGALVIQDKGNKEYIIPVFKTQSVWPIGSGDVFASIFAYYWFRSNDANTSAEKASQATAAYCSTKSFRIQEYLESTKLIPLSISDYPVGKIYLAGPFFTFAERWLIDQIRTSLIGMKLKVFSPWHDVGYGSAKDVVQKDIDGINDSKLVFAVVDGLDSGTLFEIGYAISKGIPVIAYVQNESEDSLKMLEGTGCILEKDLTTAVYLALWTLAENE